MAYSRWSDSDWYIYWLAPAKDNERPSEEVLIVEGMVGDLQQFSFLEVHDMVEQQDFSPINGFDGSQEQEDIFFAAFREFIRDVKEHYET